jgi:[ribosomal protein S5]-alanine N-acetyltransferase
MDERDELGVQEALADPEIIRWFGRSAVSPAEFIEGKKRGWSDGTSAAFAIYERGGAFAGQVFIEPGESRTAEIGYWLLPSGRGKGLATRAVQIASRWAFSSLGVARLTLWAGTENEASLRFAERSGFVYEGILRSYRGNERGRFDCAVFSLLPTDIE